MKGSGTGLYYVNEGVWDWTILCYMKKKEFVMQTTYTLCVVLDILHTEIGDRKDYVKHLCFC